MPRCWLASLEVRALRAQSKAMASTAWRRTALGQTLAQLLKRPEVQIEHLAPVLARLMPAFFERVDSGQGIVDSHKLNLPGNSPTLSFRASAAASRGPDWTIHRLLSTTTDFPPPGGNPQRAEVGRNRDQVRRLSRPADQGDRAAEALRAAHDSRLVRLRQGLRPVARDE